VLFNINQFVNNKLIQAAGWFVLTWKQIKQIISWIKFINH